MRTFDVALRCFEWSLSSLHFGLHYSVPSMLQLFQRSDYADVAGLSNVAGVTVVHGFGFTSPTYEDSNSKPKFNTEIHQ